MSSPIYELRVSNTSGVLKYVITDMLEMAYTRVVNNSGGLLFSLSGSHPALAEISKDWVIQVRRKTDTSDWRTEITALLLDENWSYTEERGAVYQAYCQGIECLLGRRIVNWPAGVANKTTFDNVPAETIMKTLVTYNATSSATVANGRKRLGKILQIAVDTDAAGGNNLYASVHGDNLLTAMRTLAKVGGGDFELYPTSASSFLFKFHEGSIGSDKTGTVKFSLELGNMSLPKYKRVISTEKTVACVWGRGVGEARDYAETTGANYATNDAEMYVDARDIEYGDTSKLEDRGDAKLKEHESKETFSFVAVQTDGTKYSDNYDLGDTVTVVNPFKGTEIEQKITSVTVQLDSDGKETIDIGMDTPDE